MWQQHLSNAGHATVYFNAWDADFSEDALLAFIAALDEQLPSSGLEDARDKVLQLGAGMLRRAIPVLLQAGTGGLLRAAELEKFAFFEKPADEIDKWVGDVAKERLAAFSAEKHAVRKFRESLSQVAGGILADEATTSPLVVFVDELDRCRPDFAIQLLERIKHLFDVDGMVFVLSLDQAELSHSICAVYGEGFDARGYLRRFIDYSYTLPAPDRCRFAEALVARSGIAELLPAGVVELLVDGIALLAEDFGFSLRTMEQTFDEASVLLRVAPRRLRESFGTLLLLIVMLRTKDANAVDGYLAAREGAEPVLERLAALGANHSLDSRFGRWVEAELRVASGTAGELDDFISEVDQRRADPSKNLTDREDAVHDFVTDLRRGGTRFRNVPAQLRQLIAFSEGVTIPHTQESE